MMGPVQRVKPRGMGKAMPTILGQVVRQQEDSRHGPGGPMGPLFFRTRKEPQSHLHGEEEHGGHHHHGDAKSRDSIQNDVFLAGKVREEKPSGFPFHEHQAHKDDSDDDFGGLKFHGGRVAFPSSCVSHFCGLPKEISCRKNGSTDSLPADRKRGKGLDSIGSNWAYDMLVLILWYFV
jgi:hypothetical protein